jgi:hypothetical protein
MIEEYLDEVTDLKQLAPCKRMIGSVGSQEGKIVPGEFGS